MFRLLQRIVRCCLPRGMYIGMWCSPSGVQEGSRAADVATASRGQRRTGSGDKAQQRAKRTTRTKRATEMVLDDDAHFHTVAPKHRAHAAGIVCASLLLSTCDSTQWFPHR